MVSQQIRSFARQPRKSDKVFVGSQSVQEFDLLICINHKIYDRCVYDGIHTVNSTGSDGEAYVVWMYNVEDLHVNVPIVSHMTHHVCSNRTIHGSLEVNYKLQQSMQQVDADK